MSAAEINALDDIAAIYRGSLLAISMNTAAGTSLILMSDSSFSVNRLRSPSPPRRRDLAASIWASLAARRAGRRGTAALAIGFAAKRRPTSSTLALRAEPRGLGRTSGVHPGGVRIRPRAR